MTGGSIIDHNHPVPVDHRGFSWRTQERSAVLGPCVCSNRPQCRCVHSGGNGEERGQDIHHCNIDHCMKGPINSGVLFFSFDQTLNQHESYCTIFEIVIYWPDHTHTYVTHTHHSSAVQSLAGMSNVALLHTSVCFNYCTSPGLRGHVCVLAMNLWTIIVPINQSKTEPVELTLKKKEKETLKLLGYSL